MYVICTFTPQKCRDIGLALDLNKIISAVGTSSFATCKCISTSLLYKLIEITHLSPRCRSNLLCAETSKTRPSKFPPTPVHHTHTLATSAVSCKYSASARFREYPMPMTRKYIPIAVPCIDLGAEMNVSSYPSRLKHNTCWNKRQQCYFVSLVMLNIA